MKECVKAGRAITNQSQLNETHGVHHYMKSIKNSLVLFIESDEYFLFEYCGKKHLMNPDFISNIYQFEEALNPPFVKAEEFKDNLNFQGALLVKFYLQLENSRDLDFYDEMDEREYKLSKKQHKFLEVILALKKNVIYL